MNEQEDDNVYNVVVNHEQQYSIWPEYKSNPPGWINVGKTGPKAECLAYIKEVWTDMRPLSLREKMDQMAKNPTPSVAVTSRTEEKSLVDRLCEGSHRVQAGVGSEKSAKLIKEAIDRAYVHITFADTRGGTALGVRLDRNACDFSDADFEAGMGNVHVEGGLTLNSVKVRCIANIDLKTLQGKGHLVKAEDLATN